MKAAHAALKLMYVGLLGAYVSLAAETPANAVTYDWSFSCLPNCVGGSGTLTTPVPPGPVLITGITGTWDGLAIVAISNFFSADDILLALTPSTALDSQGLSFLLSDGAMINLQYDETNGYESRGYDNASLDSPRGQDFYFGGTFIVSPSTTPLPLSLPLFASGLAALGLVGWRRKWKAGSLSV